ncbi:Glycosyl transferase family 2 [Proteiniborus ethanoligenes]|uniref:Glycosyl transferase family 2 n=1 Tax=Proteiniborus ethanoligenes TaxID=415015 RepID=A0A1H3K1A4_9FIRM|nr:glycosyltransferase family A protein [Proteiniborus ethanoligenes]SDY45962.1 Glycosyl transferase family 2 [Proteiniborus ethanoligenes]
MKNEQVSKVHTVNYNISVITCTNRPRYMQNVFENYNQQSFKDKELILVLNNNKMNMQEWTREAKKHDNISVFQVDEKKTLGYCLNFGIEKAKYNIIAKFDDDDYYGPEYLSQSIKGFKYADVIGKYTTFVYFQNTQTLAIRNPKRDNRYVYRIEGPTLMFKREIFNKIRFVEKSLGEDIQFCKDCTKNGIKMYAIDKYNYVYVRHGLIDKHAWNIKDELFMKLCLIIGKVDDYKKYINKK